MIPGQNKVAAGFVVGTFEVGESAMDGFVVVGCVELDGTQVGIMKLDGSIDGSIVDCDGINVDVGEETEGDIGSIVGCCCGGVDSVDVGSVDESSEGNKDGSLLLLGLDVGSVIFRGASRFVGSMVGANAI